MSPPMYRELLFPAHKRLLDFALIDAELEKRVPAAMAGGGYVLQSEYSVRLGTY